MYEEVFRRNVKMVISTIKDYDDDYALIHTVKNINERMIIAVVATHADEALELYNAGADYVIMPDELSAHHTSSLIDRLGFDIVRFVEHKMNHMQALQERIQRGLLSVLRGKL
jgi:Trk K+ transport system NAD-binding subunit